MMTYAKIGWTQFLLVTVITYFSFSLPFHTLNFLVWNVDIFGTIAFWLIEIISILILAVLMEQDPKYLVGRKH